MPAGRKRQKNNSKGKAADKDASAGQPLSTQRIKQLANSTGVTILVDISRTADESKMGSAYSYDKKSGILRIFPEHLDVSAKNLFHELMIKAFQDGHLLLRKGKERTLDSYREYLTSETDKKMLEFFDGKLPPDDFLALKMSLFLRSELNKGRGGIDVLKKDIRDRYGDRGTNIANLCTGKYFEHELMPLWSAVSKEEFVKYYEIVVGKKGRALFVHSEMSIGELGSSFEEMLRKAVKYGLRTFHVHAMGRTNVDTVKRFFSEGLMLEDIPHDIKTIDERDDPPLPPLIEYLVIVKPEIEKGNS